ncbi:MAG: 50S ribosomal protein L29 [Flavobacteriaceae bacterium]|mgnify:CR=1 FL=1|nr:50S ribosomal protein L29 [Flavobacteriaceae bacterium]|tara:strand:- start:873 stop:1073 length:201 start_codon:yes stop_codon:yes gene_type:complete
MKQPEISKLNLKELEIKINELKKRLFDLKMSSYVSELESPIQIRNTRRILARLKTAETKLKKDLIS